MAISSALASIIGVLAAGGGIALLYAAWRRRDHWRHIGGWGLLAISLAPWIWILGTHRGIAVGLIVMTLMAWLVISVTGQWRRTPGLPKNGRQAAVAPEQKPATAGQWVLLLVLAGPAAAFAAAGIGLGVMAVLSGAEANRLIAGAFTMVLVWAVGAVWSVSDPRRLRIGGTLLGTGLAGLGLAVLQAG